MAHHGQPEKDAFASLQSIFGQQDATDEIQELRESLGATGSFPEGVLSEDDKGGLSIGLTATNGKVILAFGDPVEWVGFGPEQARGIAQSLLDRAAECDGITAKVRREY